MILLIVENEVKTKHVETLLVPRLDEGSIPSISTKKHRVVRPMLSYFMVEESSILHSIVRGVPAPVRR